MHGAGIDFRSRNIIHVSRDIPLQIIKGVVAKKKKFYLIKVNSKE